MKWFFCPAGVKLREQINYLYPDRDRESDGTVGDLAHLGRKSSHNPDKFGAVRGFDVDEDLMPGIDARGLATALQVSKDPRLLYLIYEGQITVKGDITRWKKYTGVNPHRHHLHISFSDDPKLYNDKRDWDLSGLTLPVIAKPEVKNLPVLKLGAKGATVKQAQKLLILFKFLAPDGADGDFGPKTLLAVTGFQQHNGIEPDGIIGPDTWAKLLS